MRRQVFSVLALASLIGTFLAPPSNHAIASDSIAMQAAKGTLRAAILDTGKVERVLPTLSGAVQNVAVDELRAEEADAAGVTAADPVPATLGTLGCSNRNNGINVRVNQDCTFRRQAEESIAINPSSSTNVIAGQNDARIGFNHCGFDYSFDSGAHWGDGIPPFFQHLNSPTLPHSILGGPGTGHTYDAASDPAVAFDSSGNAYYSCVLFDINSNASGLFVTRSPAPAGGSFYNNVPTSGTRYIVAEDNTYDNNPNTVSKDIVFHDKEFITADSYPLSPFRDNVYVTWTVFTFAPYCKANHNVSGFCSSTIYFSRSSNHGLTWSSPQEISGSAPGLCYEGNAFTNKVGYSACDFDQGSDPIVRPDGSIVVVFNNGNTMPGDPNAQQLAVVSRDGGNTWTAPVKVGSDIIVGEPQCNFGRGPEECVPSPYIRTNDFPRIGVDRSSGVVYIAWQDYRNGEYDIQMAQSADGGATWIKTGTTQSVNSDVGMDHYMPALAVDTSSHRVGMSYYRSDRVPNENTIGVVFAPGQPGIGQGSSFYDLSGGTGVSAVPFAATTIAGPFPAPDGIQAGFNGDYSGLAIANGTAHPIWSDTRSTATVPGQGVLHDEDIFTDARAIP